MVPIRLYLTAHVRRLLCIICVYIYGKNKIITYILYINAALIPSHRFCESRFVRFPKSIADMRLKCRLYISLFPSYMAVYCDRLDELILFYSHGIFRRMNNDISYLRTAIITSCNCLNRNSGCISAAQNRNLIYKPYLNILETRTDILG